MEKNFYIMWLSGITGLGNRKVKAVIDFFGDAESVWNASSRDLNKLSSWLPENAINEMLSPGKNEKLDKLSEKMRAEEINFISIYDPAYPRLLKEISDPPIGLYIKGNMPGDNFINISIIGARRSSEYGLTVAFKFSKELASKGFTIVSGMAKGIDSMAHKGAIEGGGKTIAVLGNGLDTCYPPENKDLMKEIINNGCVISEYPPGARALPSNFPARNRIISGLCRGLLVVEAAERSGTRITADQALEQGREVFAIPGSIFSKTSAGVHQLIKDGACLVTNYKDILEGLGIDTMSIIEHNTKNGLNEDKGSLDLNGDEKTIYEHIGIEPAPVDEISIRTNLSIPVIQYCLTTLELKNLVKRFPGQRYARVF